MKKLFTIAMLAIVSSAFAQNLSISNTSNKTIRCVVYAYGTNAGYDTCSDLIHATVNVAPSSLEAFFGFSGPSGITWKDAGENNTTPAGYGNPVWVQVVYDYPCGAGIPMPRVGAKLNNALCDVASYSVSTGCSMTATWTTFSTNIAIAFDN